MSSISQLSEQELQSALVRAGVPKATVQAALKQAEAGAVQDICDAFLAVVMPRWATLAPDAENPALPAFTREIYREHGRTQARVWAMQDFMRRVGIRDFSTFDLVRPDARRIRKHVSAMVHMLRFCERKQGVIDAAGARIDDIVAQTAELEQQKAQALQELQEAEAAHARMVENAAVERERRLEVEAEAAALQPAWNSTTRMLAELQEGIHAGNRSFKELEMRQEELIHQREELRRLVVSDPEQLRDAKRAVAAKIEEEQKAYAARDERCARMRLVLQHADADTERLRQALQQAQVVLGEVAEKKKVKSALVAATSERHAEQARESRAKAEVAEREAEVEALRQRGAAERADAESRRASAQDKVRAVRDKGDAHAIELRKEADANDAVEQELVEMINEDAEFQARIERKLGQVAEWEGRVATTRAKLAKQAAFYQDMQPA